MKPDETPTGTERDAPLGDVPARFLKPATPVATSSGGAAVEQRALLMGYLLYFSAAWTLIVKYVLPVAWALRAGLPLTSFIYFWDAWWIAHLTVGWGLVRARRGVWVWAVLLALVEIAIITVKLTLFLWNPLFDFWRTNWFLNKCWLLSYFAFSMYWLTRPEVKARLKAGDVEPGDEPGPDEQNS